MSIEPGQYRDYRGAVVEVEGLALHALTEESVVVYRDDRRKLLVAPLTYFNEMVDLGRKRVPRFVRV
ncbi:MAG: DUF1653 domain-containing protein [Rhizobium sp.]|nr:MAG: DUF1653 domain-containing protein [Rhizobium sp.]